MTFIAAVTTCLRNYTITIGRAPRAEYWYFFLFTVLVSVTGDVVDELAFPPLFRDVGPAGLVAWLALLLPSLAVQIRRLRDLDKSWRWGLLIVVPLIGTIALLIMSAKRGTVGPNRFGPDPLAAPEPGLTALES